MNVLLVIPGVQSALEARYHATSTRQAPVALIVPPHPRQEGTMDHTVVHTLFRTFAGMGFNVLRFNFRGAGHSRGQFVDGETEIFDAAACLDWLQNRNSAASQCWIAGFSFGAYVALQLLMRRPECQNFVAVSPLVNFYDFSFLAPCPSPGLFIHGKESSIPTDAVMRLTHQLSMQRKKCAIDLSIVAGADHQFSQHLGTLEQQVQNYVTQQMTKNQDLASATSL